MSIIMTMFMISRQHYKLIDEYNYYYDQVKYIL